MCSPGVSCWTPAPTCPGSGVSSPAIGEVTGYGACIAVQPMLHCRSEFEHVLHISSVRWCPFLPFYPCWADYLSLISQAERCVEPTRAPASILCKVDACLCISARRVFSSRVKDRFITPDLGGKESCLGSCSSLVFLTLFVGFFSQ